MRLRPVALAAALALAPSFARADDPGEVRFRNEQALTMGVLGGWAIASMGAGAALWQAPRDDFAVFMGIQHFAWGAIDLVLAGLGMSEAKLGATPDWRAERSRTATLFLVNAGLDVAYVLAGALLWGLGGADNVRGTGAGVLSQGAFLLGFDSSAFALFSRAP